MHAKSPTWLVYVEYGETPQWYTRVLYEMSSKYGAELVRVRTDVSPGKSLDNPNIAFEFSGYQDGLNHVVERFKAMHVDVGRNLGSNRINLIFLNDTFFYGHPKYVARVLLSLLLRRSDTLGANIVGLKMPATLAVQSVAGLDSYVSTWAFKLSGPLDCIEQVRFFDDEMTVEDFHEKFYIRLPSIFVAHVDDWLSPQKFLRGWYKAVPGTALPNSTRRRKEVTIYLESSMPQRLARLGFSQLDVGETGGQFQRLGVRALKTVDKIFVNIIKMKTRLRYFFGLTEK